MRRSIALLFACCFILVPPLATPSVSQDMETFVIVPDHPQGVPINGCYRANRQLFGPYNFSFCLVRPGSYAVRGGGVRCDGRLTWRASGRNIQADIHRASCGGGVAWERATMDCHPAGRILGPIGSLFISALRCTYFPTVRHQRRQTFTANRI
jgi:hypothetical protein